jgi:hypothetical protein
VSSIQKHWAIFQQEHNAIEGRKECGAALKKTRRPGFRRK